MMARDRSRFFPLLPALLAAMAATAADHALALSTAGARETPRTYPGLEAAALEQARELAAAWQVDLDEPTSIVIPADNLLRNGGFEDGLAGWVSIEHGLGAFAAHEGGPGPFSGLPAPAPREGRRQALLDQNGEGSHLLFQDFQVPQDGAYLTCELFVHNLAADFAVGPSLLHDLRDAAGTRIANQHLRVDLLDPSEASDAPSEASDDPARGVLRNLLLTTPGSSRLDGWFRLVADLDDFAGATIRLRFAAVDNLGPLRLGVDGCAVRPRTRQAVSSAGEETAIVPVDTVAPQNAKTAYYRDGGKAVFWQQDGPGGTIICTQFFDENDQKLTDPLLVNEKLGPASLPTGQFDPDGNAFIFWTFFDSAAIRTERGGRVTYLAAAGPTVVGRKFSPNGSALSGEIAVGAGEEPESSSARSGEQTLTWNDDGAILTQVFGPDGAPLGPPITINDDLDGLAGPKGSQAAAVAIGGEGQAVATSASGDYVVVWQQSSIAGPERGIYLRCFGEAGQPKGPTEPVTLSVTASSPAVAMDAAGNFVVVWQQGGVGSANVNAQRYDARCRKLGGSFQVNSGTPGDELAPRVDVNEAGDFVVVWEEAPVSVGATATAQGTSVVGRAFDPNGQSREQDQVVAGPEPNNDPHDPDVTINENDDVTVVFERRRTNQQSRGIFRREIDYTPPAESCAVTGTTQCLNTERFRVSALFEQPTTRVVSNANAARLTGDTGFFTFFDPANVEAVVKVLDGCAINGRFWVFLAGLTDVEVTLRVDDVLTGRSVTYFNRRGQPFPPILDTDAFPDCPGNAAAGEIADLSEAETAGLASSLLRDLQGDLPGELRADLAPPSRRRPR